MPWGGGPNSGVEVNGARSANRIRCRVASGVSFGMLTSPHQELRSDATVVLGVLRTGKEVNDEKESDGVGQDQPVCVALILAPSREAEAAKT